MRTLLTALVCLLAAGCDAVTGTEELPIHVADRTYLGWKVDGEKHNGIANGWPLLTESVCPDSARYDERHIILAAYDLRFRADGTYDLSTNTEYADCYSGSSFRSPDSSGVYSGRNDSVLFGEAVAMVELADTTGGQVVPNIMSISWSVPDYDGTPIPFTVEVMRCVGQNEAVISDSGEQACRDSW